MFSVQACMAGELVVVDSVSGSCCHVTCTLTPCRTSTRWHRSRQTSAALGSVSEACLNLAKFLRWSVSIQGELDYGLNGRSSNCDLPSTMLLTYDRENALAVFEIAAFIFRSTPLSRPNKLGLKCPYVRPSVHEKFLQFRWNLVCR